MEENENLEGIMQEQENSENYFEMQEGKINETKEKLQKLLEKLQSEPPKETLTKKILRIRIDRLRSTLNKSMEKFNLEYEAKQKEDEAYDKFVLECNEIIGRMEELKEKEDELQFKLEFYMRKEAVRQNEKNQLIEKIGQVAPKGQRNDSKVERRENKSRKSQMKRVEKNLHNVQNEISVLQEELEGRIAAYREAKIDLQEKVKEDVKNSMMSIKEQDKEQRNKRKEELAIVKPSIWEKIKASVKEKMNKLSKWNENRKQQNADKSQKKDEIIMQDLDATLSRKTARQEFLENINVQDTEIKKQIANEVEIALSEKEENAKDEELDK